MEEDERALHDRIGKARRRIERIGKIPVVDVKDDAAAPPLDVIVIAAMQQVVGARRLLHRVFEVDGAGERVDHEVRRPRRQRPRRETERLVARRHGQPPQQMEMLRKRHFPSVVGRRLLAGARREIPARQADACDKCLELSDIALADAQPGDGEAPLGRGGLSFRRRAKPCHEGKLSGLYGIGKLSARPFRFSMRRWSA